MNLKLDGYVIEDIRLVIFDKDGTLIDLYNYWAQMIDLRARLICHQLGLGKAHKKTLIYEMGVDQKRKRLRPEGPVGVKSREVVLQSAIDYLSSVGHTGSDNLCFSVFEEVDRTSTDDLKRYIKPIIGATDLINMLSTNNCKIAIATTDRAARGKLAMEFLGLADKIDSIVGADMVTKTKPNAESIYTILDILKIDKSNAVMVGDALTDVQMGVNAGLKASIGVLSGLAGEGELSKITKYVVDSVADIEVMNA